MDYQGHGEDNTCPACGKYFRTTQGLLAHLSSARSCSWWKEENQANREYQEQLDISQHGSNDDNDNEEENGEAFDHGGHGFLYPDADDDGPPELDAIEEPEDVFHFVGTGLSTSSNRTRLPQSRALDEEDDQQVED